MRRTTLCYLQRDEHYLMLHRVKKQNDANHEKWIGIGGGIEIDETPEQCILREVFEETGLTLKRWRERGILEFRSDCWEDETIYLFTADSWTGEMIECDEGNLEWVPIKQVTSLPIWQGDRIFLRLLREEQTDFKLDLEYRGDTLIKAVLNGNVLDLDEWR